MTVKYMIVSEYGDIQTDIVPKSPKGYNIFNSREEALNYLNSIGAGGVFYLLKICPDDIIDLGYIDFEEDSS